MNTEHKKVLVNIALFVLLGIVMLLCAALLVILVTHIFVAGPTAAPEPHGVSHLSGLDVSGDEPDLFVVNQTGAGDIVEFRDNGTVVLRIADGGAITTDYTINSLIDYQAITTDTTMTAAQSGRMWSNAGASVTATLTLPAAASGVQLCFYTYAAQTIYIDPVTGDQIHHLTNAAGDKISNATAGDSICLLAVDTTYWIPLKETGTWADAN